MTILEIIYSTALIFTSIFSPAFVSRENHKFQLKINQQLNEQALKMKELEFYYQTRTSAISSFLETLFICVSEPNEENLKKYKIATGKAYIYLPKEARDCLDSIEYNIAQNHKGDLKSDFNDLLEALNKDSVK